MLDVRNRVCVRFKAQRKGADVTSVVMKVVEIKGSTPFLSVPAILNKDTMGGGEGGGGRAGRLDSATTTLTR